MNYIGRIPCVYIPCGLPFAGKATLFSCLPFFGTSDGGGQTEHDVDTPGDVAAGQFEARTSSENHPDRRTKQGIEAIGAACQHRKRDPKHK